MTMHDVLAMTKLEIKLATAKSSVERAVHRAGQRVARLEQEADAQAEPFRPQMRQATDEVKVRIEERMNRVKSVYRARGAELAQAWSLTKDSVWA
jgi:hypothetical protein